MNKSQHDYSKKIQAQNRQEYISQLEKKLAKLKEMYQDVYEKGQRDKKQNRRKCTLLEYKKAVIQYTGDINKYKKQLNYVRKKELDSKETCDKEDDQKVNKKQIYQLMDINTIKSKIGDLEQELTFLRAMLSDCTEALATPIDNTTN